MKTRLDRREFVKLAGTAGIAAAGGEWERALAFQQRTAPGPDAAEKQIVLLALDAVKSAGASYADVRITRNNNEVVATRERQITNVGKRETYGIGIRARVGGSWGFAATRDLSRDSVVSTARRAAAMTRSMGMAGSASAIFSRTDRFSSTFSCSTTPIWRRNQAGSAMARSMPSTKTRPLSGT